MNNNGLQYNICSACSRGAPLFLSLTWLYVHEEGSRNWVEELVSLSSLISIIIMIIILISITKVLIIMCIYIYIYRERERERYTTSYNITHILALASRLGVFGVSRSYGGSSSSSSSSS